MSNSFDSCLEISSKIDVSSPVTTLYRNCLFDNATKSILSDDFFFALSSWGAQLFLLAFFAHSGDRRQLSVLSFAAQRPLG